MKWGVITKLTQVFSIHLTYHDQKTHHFIYNHPSEICFSDFIFLRRMIVLENQDIHTTILTIMEELKLEGKTPSTLRTYQTSFNSFERYLTDNGIVSHQ